MSVVIAYGLGAYGLGEQHARFLYRCIVVGPCNQDADRAIGQFLARHYRQKELIAALVRLGNLEIVGQWPIVVNADCTANGRVGCCLARVAEVGPETVDGASRIVHYTERAGASRAFAWESGMFYENEPTSSHYNWQSFRETGSPYYNAWIDGGRA
jgi:hypothetical protein